VLGAQWKGRGLRTHAEQSWLSYVVLGVQLEAPGSSSVFTCKVTALTLKTDI